MRLIFVVDLLIVPILKEVIVTLLLEHVACGDIFRFEKSVAEEKSILFIVWGCEDAC